MPFSSWGICTHWYIDGSSAAAASSPGTSRRRAAQSRMSSLSSVIGAGTNRGGAIAGW